MSHDENAVSLFLNDTSCAKKVFLFPKICGNDFLRITLSVSESPSSVFFGSNSGCVSRRSTSSSQSLGMFIR